MSAPEPNRLRATARDAASVFASGCLRGVLAGVGSIWVSEEAVWKSLGFRCDWGLGVMPKAPAALAVLLEVKVPEARRTESMAGVRFF